MPFQKKSGFSKKQEKAVRTIVKKVTVKNAENKQIYKGVLANCDSTGNVTDLLLSMSKGDSDQAEADGDTIQLKSIRMKFSITGVSGEANVVRVMLVQWKSDSTTNNLTGVDKVLSINGLGTYGYVYNQKIEFAQATNLCNVIYDRTFTTVSGTSSEVQFVNKDIYKGFARQVDFNGLSATPGSAQGYNKLYLLAMSDSGVASHPIIIGQVRINYTDS